MIWYPFVLLYAMIQIFYLAIVIKTTRSAFAAANKLVLESKSIPDTFSFLNFVDF
jgi:hypothetical protein